MDPEPFSFLPDFDSTLLTGSIALAILLLASALISGAEVALFSLTQKDLDEAKETKSKSFEIIIELLKRPKKLLASILVANNFINIAIVILFAYIGQFLFSSIENEVFRFLLEVICATFLILLFGEIIPKIYASRNSLKFSIAIARPLRFLDVVFSPISIPLQFITNQIQNGLGKQKSNISVDQLSQALALSSEKDKLHEDHKILQGIVTFGNTDTKQVMKPRMDIFALDETVNYESIIPEIIANGYSRIPVFKDNIDTITGILYVKDLMPFIDRKELNWNALIRKPYFVPENKKLDDLLNEFKEMHMHMAIVVDEYGGTSGLISLEDIIEEIVGEIADEFDDGIEAFIWITEDKARARATLHIEDLADELKVDIDKADFEDVDSIGGLMAQKLGRVPIAGSTISIAGWTITSERPVGRRRKISSVMIERIKDVAPEDHE